MSWIIPTQKNCEMYKIINHQMTFSSLTNINVYANLIFSMEHVHYHTELLTRWPMSFKLQNLMGKKHQKSCYMLYANVYLFLKKKPATDLKYYFPLFIQIRYIRITLGRRIFVNTFVNLNFGLSFRQSYHMTSEQLENGMCGIIWTTVKDFLWCFHC